MSTLDSIRFPHKLCERRIGRTGRAGKTGIAHTLFHEGDKLRAGELVSRIYLVHELCEIPYQVNVLRQAGQDVPTDLLKFGTSVKKKEHKLYGAFAREVDFTKKPTMITFDDT
jgi:ATP-dependent RNA helicase DBP3